MHTNCLFRTSTPVELYEQDELHAVTGGTLRPGGIELTRELLEFSGLAPGSAMLDIGCGPGHSLEMMARNFGLRPTGVDPSLSMLAKARQQAPMAELLQGTANALPCAEGQFDGLLCECVLSLTEDMESSLCEMHRVLKPAGKLILTDIYCKQLSLQARLPELKSCINRALPLENITDSLTRAGFSLTLLRDRSDLLKQLAGQIIFSYGSLEKFWSLFMDSEAAQRTSCALASAPLGYYVLVAKKGGLHG
ncbi:MAG: class I SAM-dependent methyltransferase [Desulfobulbus sp.]|nr:class I SAM-dependent methyltransferase [Desulfobulbus sp.]